MTKVMFLVAEANSRYDEHNKSYFDNKIWPRQQEESERTFDDVLIAAHCQFEFDQTSSSALLTLRTL